MQREQTSALRRSCLGITEVCYWKRRGQAYAIPLVHSILTAYESNSPTFAPLSHTL